MIRKTYLALPLFLFFIGCYRYHHNVRTVVSPAIIFKPFHFKSKYHHNYRGHYNSYYKRGRGH